MKKECVTTQVKLCLLLNSSLPARGYHKDVKRDDNIYFFDRVDLAVSNIRKILSMARLHNVEVMYTFIEAQTKDGRDSSLDYKVSQANHSQILD